MFSLLLQITHGGVTVDIEYVNNILDKITDLEKVNFKFLKDFSQRLDIQLR